MEITNLEFTYRFFNDIKTIKSYFGVKSDRFVHYRKRGILMQLFLTNCVSYMGFHIIIKHYKLDIIISA